MFLFFYVISSKNGIHCVSPTTFVNINLSTEKITNTGNETYEGVNRELTITRYVLK